MSPDVRRFLWRALQVAFVVAVFAYGGRRIAAEWTATQAQAGQGGLLVLRWGPLLGATALVYLTYLLLVQLWRFVLHAWRTRLTLRDALAIWFISALGRYVPGRVAAIAAMAVMSRRRGVSAAAATGSAVLNTLLNIAAGLLVAVALGGAHLDRILPGAGRVAPLFTGLALAGIVALPWLLPRLARAAARLTRRDIDVPPTPASAVWLTLAGNVVAWVAYGVAFRWFTSGVLGDATGATTSYIAVYTLSYVAGYLFLPAPGGLGVREGVMVAGLTAFGLASEPEAWLVAFASRLWLLLLEILPGLIFLAHSAVRPRPPLTSSDASP